MPTSQQKPTLLSTLVRHYDELVDHVRYRFGDPGFARDVVHNVCVRLLVKRQREEVHTPLALLRKISLDEALDQLRGEKRNQRLLETLAEGAPAITEPNLAERHYQAEQELELLAQAIREMPSRRRMVFVMHKVHDLPQAEVAARMGISLKAVEKHVRLGMTSCRLYLEQGVTR